MDGLKQLTFRIKGVAPLITHNGRLSDPLDPVSVALSKAVKDQKKRKTDDMLVEVSRVEFLGGLYIGDDGGPCIPGEVMEACIRTGAKATKEGKSVQAGLICDGNFPIIYQGPRDPDKLWAEGHKESDAGPMDGRLFVDRRRVRVGQAAVMRTRPIFREWELKFSVYYDPGLINRGSLVDFVNAAGRSGLCENRPRFGRFEVVEFS
jgi:hypothetical protein